MPDGPSASWTHGRQRFGARALARSPAVSRSRARRPESLPITRFLRPCPHVRARADRRLDGAGRRERERAGGARAGGREALRSIRRKHCAVTPDAEGSVASVLSPGKRHDEGSLSPDRVTAFVHGWHGFQLSIEGRVSSSRRPMGRLAREDCMIHVRRSNAVLCRSGRHSAHVDRGDGALAAGRDAADGRLP